MIGLILAAGKGTRLSAGNDVGVCKALVEVGGRPLICYSLDNLRRLQVKKAVIVVGPDHKNIISTLGERYHEIELHYAVQEHPVGLMNAAVCGKDEMTQDVVFQLSDEIFLQSAPAGALLDAFERADFLVGYTHDTEDKIRRNFSLTTDEMGRILSCEEKPKTVVNQKKGTGFCVFSKECYQSLAASYDAARNWPNDLCDFINLLIQNGKVGMAFHIAEEEININTPEELAYARVRVQQRGMSS